MEAVRKVGAIVIAAMAIVVWFAMAPDSSGENDLDTTTSASMIDSIMTNDVSDQARAEGAPQQSVVNGWTARDLLEVIARQGAAANPDKMNDHRPAALLVLVVVGVALLLYTSGIPKTQEIESGTPQPSALPLHGEPPAG